MELHKNVITSVDETRPQPPAGEGRESPRSVVDRITDDTSESSEEEHSLSARLVAAEQHINMLQCMLAQRDYIIMQQSAVMWHQQQHVAALQHQAAHVHFGANQMHAQLMRERQYYAWVMHASNRNADPIGDTEAPASPIVEETEPAKPDSEESQRATLEEVPELERETPHHASAEATPSSSTAAEAVTAAVEPEVKDEQPTPLAQAHEQESTHGGHSTPEKKLSWVELADSGPIEYVDFEGFRFFWGRPVPEPVPVTDTTRKSSSTVAEAVTAAVEPEVEDEQTTPLAQALEQEASTSRPTKKKKPAPRQYGGKGSKAGKRPGRRRGK